MKHLFLLFLFSFITNSIFGQSNLTINQPAPPITITDWVLNKPANTNLKGQFMVLEFWATWCGPCIAAVPHMNTLQKKFSNKKLLFLSITDESVKKINRTLEKIDFKSAVVVTDLTKQTQIQFGNGKTGLEAYPMTVLIDNQGLVKWVGEPENLTEDILEKFLDKTLEGEHYFKKIKENSNENLALLSNNNTSKTMLEKFAAISQDQNQKIYFELSETNSDEIYKQMMGKKAMFLSPVSIKEIYSDVFNIKIATTPLINSVRYNFLYKNKNEDGQNMEMLRTLILSSLGLKEESKNGVSSEYLVTIKDQTRLKPAAETLFSSKSDADDEVLFSNFSIGDMLSAMEKVLDFEIKYSGNDQGKYDFIISSDNPENFKSSLKSYGLAVKTEKVEVQQIHLVKK